MFFLVKSHYFGDNASSSKSNNCFLTFTEGTAYWCLPLYACETVVIYSHKLHGVGMTVRIVNSNLLCSFWLVVHVVGYQAIQSCVPSKSMLIVWNLLFFLSPICWKIWYGSLMLWTCWILTCICHMRYFNSFFAIDAFTFQNYFDRM